MPRESTIGKVYLIGAGPGDPGLISVRGLQALAQSDLILYDYLVNPAILQGAGKDAEIVCLGQHGRTRIWRQEEINATMIDAARAGKTVARLKGGDPAIFGRGAEEAEVLAAQQIPFEIVPGITAASAAMAYAGIPLTHRDCASAVALLTGHEKDDGDAATSLDYAAFANFPGTLVVYMGVTTAEHWVRQLIDAGKDPQTPAAIVRHCSLPDQLSITCTLASIPQQIARLHLRPPAVIIIGDAVRLGPQLSWFERLPLFGQTILVTRPDHQAQELCQRFAQLGAQVVRQPAIHISPPADWSNVDAVINRLHEFAWIVFSSANGVDYFMQRLRERGLDLRALGHMKIAVIGPGTAAQLKSVGLNADRMPDTFVAESLAQTLASETAGQRVLLIRASRGREVLAETLTSAGVQVEQVVVYESRDVLQPEADIVELLNAGKIHWVTVTSSAIASSLVRLFGQSLHHTRLVSISPITTAELKKHGLLPAAEAARQTMEGVVEAVRNAAS